MPEGKEEQPLPPTFEIAFIDLVGFDQLSDIMLYYNGMAEIDDTIEICSSVAAVAYSNLTELRKLMRAEELEARKQSELVDRPAFKNVPLAVEIQEKCHSQQEKVNLASDSQKQRYQLKPEQGISLFEGKRIRRS